MDFWAPGLVLTVTKLSITAKKWLGMARNRMIPTTRAKNACRFGLLTESRLSTTPTAQLGAGAGVVWHNEYGKG